MTRPGPDPAGDAAAALVCLLAAEAEALRRADFGTLAALAEEKARLIVGCTGADGRTLGRIRDRMARNATLFEAAMQGLRGALDRLEALASGPSGLRTYDRAGRLVATGAPESRLTRNA